MNLRDHARIANCAAKGFDAVEPDQIDGYVNSTGAAGVTAQTKHWNLSWYKLGLPNNGGRQPCVATF